MVVSFVITIAPLDSGINGYILGPVADGVIVAGSGPVFIEQRDPLDAPFTVQRALEILRALTFTPQQSAVRTQSFTLAVMTDFAAINPPEVPTQVHLSVPIKFRQINRLTLPPGAPPL